MFIARKYTDLLKRYPLLTKSITGGILALASDFTSQTIERRICVDIVGMLKIEGSQTFDYKRNIRFGLFNLIINVPILHYYTAHLLPKLCPVSGVFTLLRKVAFDQIFAAPVFLTIFFGGLTLCEFRGMQAAIDKCRERLWPTLKTNWMIWPLANLINFGLVPIHYQVLFSNVASFGWGTYLSYVQNALKQ
eukprot:TRINITY_DN2083_c0_g2_i10.p1 TRINITY_DN2083_c0_g2~~TRINITY_DN2083_c0_g2_i10.p1  ORF type:complete len:191 (-),score=24.17 TRINITY_DN2083_c0_g2_i10:151-723(-)